MAPVPRHDRREDGAGRILAIQDALMTLREFGRMAAAVWCLVATTCSAPKAHAALIGVDFNESGAAPTNWNRFTASNSSSTTATPITRNNLLNETGAATAVDFSLSSTFGFVRGFDNTLSAAVTPTHINPLTLLGGYLHNDTNADDTVTATFSSLAPGEHYRVWVFGTRVSSDIDNMVTILGGGAPIAFRQLGTGSQFFVNGELGTSARTLQSYALTATAAAGGTLSIRWTEGPTASRYSIGGVAIEAMPEPATGPLLASGVAALAWKRRRPAATCTKRQPTEV